MRKITLLILSISGLTVTSFGKWSREHPEMKNRWGAWKRNYNKNYKDDDENKRMDIFVDNHNRIEEFNADPENTATLEMNEFGDMTEEEFAKFLGYKEFEHPHKNFVEEKDDKRFLASLPSSVDWRSKGAVTPVKSQGHCGGCWAFAATGALEGLHKIKSGKLQSFSEQQIINCDKYSRACVNGHTDHAFAYTSEYGVQLESTNPFTGKSGSCNYKASNAAKVNSGHVNVPKKNMNALLAAVAKQPVAITLAGAVDAFRFYKSGVLTNNCKSATTHAVLVVGYTNIDGKQALIVKNSWGPNWGQKGYVYISTNSSVNNGFGVCGVLNNPSYPTA